MRKASTSKKTLLPLFSSKVKAGFPSPAEEYIDSYLDLNEYIVKNPSATFFVRVQGDSMIEAGIFDGDILVVDKSVNAKSNDIIIAYLDGEFNVKRYIKQESKIFLISENKLYNPKIIKSDTNFEIWGVVTFVISKKR